MGLLRRRVIVADDDQVIRHIFKHLLTSWGYEPVAVSTGSEALVAFRESPPALMILDWEMPGMSGVEVCKKVRAELNDYHPYIVLVSSHSEMNYVATALHLGADDFISKPVNPGVLKARIAVGIRAFDLQDKLLIAQRQLEYQAAHDPLTRLENRRSAVQRLKTEALRVQNSGERLILGICDIDHFKPINDVYGHPVGDRILIEFAHRLESCFRPYDIIGRWGGEEFIVAMSTNEKDYWQVYDRFRKSVASTPFLQSDLGLEVNVSIGLSVYEPKLFGEAPNINQLIVRADKALYDAKNSGRNKVLESTSVSGVS